MQSDRSSCGVVVVLKNVHMASRAKDKYLEISRENFIPKILKANIAGSLL